MMMDEMRRRATIDSGRLVLRLVVSALAAGSAPNEEVRRKECTGCETCCGCSLVGRDEQRWWMSKDDARSRLDSMDRASAFLTVCWSVRLSFAPLKFWHREEARVLAAFLPENKKKGSRPTLLHSAHAQLFIFASYNVT